MIISMSQSSLHCISILMAAVINPKMLDHDRSLFLFYTKSETGILDWGIALPQVVVRGAGVFSPVVLPSATRSLRAHHAYLHQACGRDRSVEGRMWQVFTGQAGKWYPSLHLRFHGRNPATRRYLTAKRSGEGSLTVCPN